MSAGDGREPGRFHRFLRWLLPGPLGEEACLDLEREYRERRSDSALDAWLWRIGLLVRPSTWALARALRGDRRRNASTAERPVVQPGWRTPVSWLDLKLGLRVLASSPVITAVSAIAIAITIAVAVAGFSFFQDFGLRPTVPLHEGERVVSLAIRTTDTNRMESRLLHEVEAWRDELRTLEHISSWRNETHTIVSADGQGELAHFAAMSASGFAVARVPPLMGRPLLESDELEGAPRVMVLGYGEWVRRFGADPEIVGTRVQVGYEPYTVVGVMPEGFSFPFAERLWIPPTEDVGDYPPLEGPGGYYAFARLAPGATLQQARAEMTALMERRASVYPDTHRHLRGQVLSYSDPYTGMGDTGDAHTLLVRTVMGLLTLVVLIPFANVAILVYARTATRAGEIAVRTALGASRMRVIGQLFLEALLVAVPATLVGIGLAIMGLDYAARAMDVYFGSGMPFWAKNGRDPWTIAYATGLTLFVAAAAGVIPGLQATGDHVQRTLKGAGNANGMRLGRVWTGMVVVQVAITVAVLPMAGWVAWQALGLRLAHPTFAAEQYIEVLVAGAPLGPPVDSLSPVEAETEGFLVTVADRLEDDPRISGAALSSRSPVGLNSVGFSDFTRVEVEGIAPPEDFPYHRLGSMEVDAGFFAFLGVPVRDGREFVPADLEDAVPPLLVNRAFVDRVLQGANPIGRSIRPFRAADEEPAPCSPSVGVVSDILANPMQPDAVEPMMYGPLDRQAAGHAFLTLRAESPSDDLVSDIRRTITEVDPGLRLYRAAPLSEPGDPIRAVMAAISVGVGAVLVSVLVLCAAGVFSLISFNVTRRRREIGIRRALGASQRRVLGTVIARSAKQLVVGALVGGLVAALAPPLTFEGGPATKNPWLLACVALLLLGMGLVATVGPALEAMRVQPTRR